MKAARERKLRAVGSSEVGLRRAQVKTGESAGPVFRTESLTKYALGDGIGVNQLPPGIIGAVDESFIVTFSPGAVAPSDGLFSRHQGAEFCFVHEGVLTLSLGFEKYDLGAGDAIAFQSTVPHLYANEGTVPVRALWQQSERFLYRDR